MRGGRAQCCWAIAANTFTSTRKRPLHQNNAARRQQSGVSLFRGLVNTAVTCRGCSRDLKDPPRASPIAFKPGRGVGGRRWRAEKIPPIDLDRESQIEIERPNETREQRRNSVKGSCRKIRTNTAADRPPGAKKFGDTQNPVSSGNPSPRTQPGRGVTPLRGHRPRAQLAHSQTHLRARTHTHTHTPERLYLTVRRLSGRNAVAHKPGLSHPTSPARGWSAHCADAVPADERATDAGTKGPGSTAEGANFTQKQALRAWNEVVHVHQVAM